MSTLSGSEGPTNIITAYQFVDDEHPCFDEKVEVFRSSVDTTIADDVVVSNCPFEVGPQWTRTISTTKQYWWFYVREIFAPFDIWGLVLRREVTLETTTTDYCLQCSEPDLQGLPGRQRRIVTYHEAFPGDEESPAYGHLNPQKIVFTGPGAGEDAREWPVCKSRGTQGLGVLDFVDTVGYDVRWQQNDSCLVGHEAPPAEAPDMDWELVDDDPHDWSGGLSCTTSGGTVIVPEDPPGNGEIWTRWETCDYSVDPAFED